MDNFVWIAVCGDQRLQKLCFCGTQVCAAAHPLKSVRVLAAYAHRELLFGFPGYVAAFEKLRQNVKIRYIQFGVVAQNVHAFRRQQKNLADALVVDSAETLQPYLHYLLEVVRLRRDSVDVLVVEELDNAVADVPVVLDYRQGNVRLERHEHPVRIRKCYYLS